MTRRIFSGVYLLTGILIGLGAFGHGLRGIRPVDAALAAVALDAHVASLLHVVWYFVSGCMLVFAAIVIWTWLRAGAGDRRTFFASDTIGVFYVASGIAAVWYAASRFSGSSSCSAHRCWPARRCCAEALERPVTAAPLFAAGAGGGTSAIPAASCRP
jgi:hypothetical protein